jgi:hypothetical protein
MTATREFEDAMLRIERLSTELSRATERETAEKARALVRAVLDAHAAGLGRVLELVRKGLAAEIVADPIIQALLELDGVAAPLAATSPLVPLERLVRRASVDQRAGDPSEEHCELCGAKLADSHDHLLDLATDGLECSCPACSLLFTGEADAKKRRVEHRIEALEEPSIDDALWDALGIPIGLAFIVKRAGRTSVVYPGAGGPVTAELGDLPELLADVEDEVEALLINRLGPLPREYKVSIDECHHLVGLVRRQWRGFSGGGEVGAAITNFFARLDARGRRRPTGTLGALHA